MISRREFLTLLTTLALCAGAKAVELRSAGGMIRGGRINYNSGGAPAAPVTGDITSVTVRADGWSADLVVNGFTTGATYAFGLGANNDPSTAKMVFTVVSQGYDNAGSLGTVSRTVYGTKQVRKPDPDEATIDETGGGNLTVRIALSDYIYIDDNTGAAKSGTAPTVTIAAGLVMNAGGASETSAATTALAVTNNSTAVYPKVVANWSWPGNQRVTGDFPLRCVAFHGTSVFTDATTQVGGGKMNIACVKFTVADTSAHTATTTVTAPSVDASLSDAVPVVEWVGTMAVSALTALDVLTCNFIAYPLVGDAGSIVDTSAGTAQPTPLFGPINMLNDKSDTYGRTFAAALSTGNDTTGIAVKREDYASDALADAAAMATPCLTIGGAYAKIVAKNLADRSRNTGGAGEIVLGAENYAFIGAGSAFGTKPTDWAIIRPADGITRAQANITTGNGDLKDMVKLQGITVSGSAAFTFINIDTIWFDNCVMSTTGAATVNNGCLSQYWTRNVMAGFGQGILPSTTWTSAPSIIRGNNFDSYLKTIFGYCILGNSKSTTDISSLRLIVGDLGTVGQQVMPHADNAIIAFNKLLGVQAGAAAVVYWGFVNPRTHGCALVQNVFENWDNGPQAIIDLAGTVGATPVNNILVWNNVFAGQRSLNAYNDTGTTSLERKFWSEKNNINDYYAIKSDTFTTASGNRIGNWPVVFGVASSGNLMAALTGLSGNAFPKEFSGLGTLQNTSLQANDYVKYTTDLAYKGGADTAGGGTYTLQVTSPAKNLQRDWLLPYDIAGNPRSATDDAGAYAAP